MVSYAYFIDSVDFSLLRMFAHSGNIHVYRVYGNTCLSLVSDNILIQHILHF